MAPAESYHKFTKRYKYLDHILDLIYVYNRYRIGNSPPLGGGQFTRIPPHQQQKQSNKLREKYSHLSH